MFLVSIVWRVLAFAVRFLFRAVKALRLGVPLLYAFTAVFLCPGWSARNPGLAMGILYVLVGLAVLSWVMPLVRRRGTESGTADKKVR